MRVLLLTPRPPAPPVGGDRLRLNHLLRHLAARHEVTLMCLAASAQDEVAARELRPLVHDVHVFREPRVSRLVRAGMGILSSRPLQCSYFHSPRLAHAVGRLGRGAFDVALGSLIRTAGYLLDSPLPTLIDVQDAISLNYRRALPHLPPHLRALYRVEAPRVERFEDEVLRRADACTLISPVDLREVSRRVEGARLRLLGNGVDVARFEPAGAAAPVPGRLLFLGNLRTLANRDMVTHLVRDVMPRTTHPAAQLRIVGIECPPALAQLHDGVRTVVVGEVDDPRPHLWGAWATVCPMRFGAGVPNKVLESLAAGTPAVVSPIAAEALGLADGEGVVVAAGGAETARACDALLGDAPRRHALAAAGMDVVRQRFTWDRALAPLDGLLEEVAGLGG